jgi:hypothetical protein
MKVIKQKYKVIDNFLLDHELTEINQAVMNGGFPWFSDNNGIGYSGDLSDKYFIHTLYASHQPNSTHYNLLMPILEKLEVKALIRAKVNLYLRNDTFIEHGAHRDFGYPHKAFILYLNTNNGFTRLVDGQVIESVANRGVVFSGNEFHNSTNCTDALYRANISINYF